MCHSLQHTAFVFLDQNQGIWGYLHGPATAVPKIKANFLNRSVLAEKKELRTS
jgi:hypothetical protein